MALRLGRDTASVVNHLYSRSLSPAPEVGMPATVLHWTDRTAGTVIRVSPSGKTIDVQADTATRIDRNGMSEAQSYTFARNPQGRVFTFRLGRDGRWRGVVLGERAQYHDFSF